MIGMRSRIAACSIPPSSSASSSYACLGLRAGGGITALGGRRQGREALVATTTTVPSVDIGALSAAIASDVCDRLAASATTTIQWCHEDSCPRLTEIQQSTLLKSLF